jgi:O-antigen ligase
MRKLRWQPNELAPSKHPYRDSAIIYGALAGIVVLVAVATGGSLVKAVIAAASVFVAATLYSWWRWRVKLRNQERAK